MADAVRVLIVDDNADTRDGTRRLLEYEDGIEIAGFAENGQVAVEQARELQPHVILMDINMPIMDGLQATEIIKKDFPAIQIIVVSVQDDSHYMRQAFQRGATDFVAKPITSAELARAIEEAYKKYLSAAAVQEQQLKVQAAVPSRVETIEKQRDAGTVDGQVISFLSFKGGVGKTFLAVNTAAGLVRSSRDKSLRVVLVDGNLLFGDVAVSLNTRSQYSVTDLAQMTQEPEGIDNQTLDTVLVPHDSGIKLLLAASNPANVQPVSSDAFSEMLDFLRTQFHYVVVDTAPTFNEVSAAVIRSADLLVAVTTPTLPALKDTRLLYNELDSASYSRDKLLLIVNEIAEGSTIKSESIGNYLGQEVSVQIPFDSNVVTAVNDAKTVFDLDKRSPAVNQLVALVKLIRESGQQSGIGEEPAEEEPRRTGLFSGLLGT